MYRRGNSQRKRSCSLIESLESRTLLTGSLLGETFNYPLGNFTNANLTLNHATISDLPFGAKLGLTDGGPNEAASAFTQTPCSLGSFTTDFSFQVTFPQNGGLTFAIQGNSPTSLGSSGAGLGIAGVGKSVAVEFNLTGGVSQTALAINGVAGAATDLTTAGLNFHNGDQIAVEIAYAAGKLKVTETDVSTPTNPTPATAMQMYSVSLSGVVGASQAYIGFTGSDGSTAPTDSVVEVLNWNFNAVPFTVTATGESAPFNDSSTVNQYTLGAVGAGLGNTTDQARLVTQSLDGNGTVTAELSPPSAGAAGLTIRNGLANNATFVALFLQPNGAAVFQSRSAAGASSTIGGTLPGFGAATPILMKIVSDGPTMSGYISPATGVPAWTLVGTASFISPTKLQYGLVAWSGSSSVAPVTFNHISLTRDTDVGVDLGDAGQRWKEQSQMWVDVMNQANPILTPTDANGDPTTDFSTTLLVTEANNLGTYHLSMQVAQNPTLSFSGGVVSNQQYDPATQTLNADVTFSKLNVTVVMKVTNTGGGATDIHFIRPGYDPNNHPVFTTTYIDFLRSLNPRILRFMNFLSTNNNPVQTWAQRQLPTNATQTQTMQLVDFFGKKSIQINDKGTSWEYAILLANAVHADMWINIPAHADDEYIQNLANLIKNGDTIGGVTYPGLAPDLNVYIEISNESWNPGFDVFKWDVEAANSEITASTVGGPATNLDYDNLSLAQQPGGAYVNGATFGLRYFARRLLQAGQLFQSVFGAGSLNTRIRPILSSAQPSNMAMMAQYITANYGPLSNYFYALGDIIYMNNNGPLNTKNTLTGGFSNPNLTPRQLLLALAANAVSEEAYYDQVNNVAQQYGMRIDAYEAGIDLSGSADIPARVAAVEHTATTAIIEQDVEHFYTHGGDAFLYFTGDADPYGSPYGDYQMTDDVTNPVTPKFLGFVGAATADRPILMPAAPTSLTANVISASEIDLAWTDPANDQTMFRVQYSSDPSFKFNLREVDLPATTFTYKFTTLRPGTPYYFRVLAANTADNSDNPPHVLAQTLGTPVAPVAPGNLSALAVSNSEIDLTWTEHAWIETGFHLDVSTDPKFATVAQTLTLAPDTTAASVFGLDANTKYYFRVRSFNAAGDSPNSNLASTITLPLMPIANYHLDETTGTTASDSAANSANGTLIGGVTHVPGLRGNALSFDGSSGYVNLNSPAKLNFSGQITISLWIKPTSVTQPVYLVDKGNDGNFPFFLQLTDAQTVVFGTHRATGGTHQATAIAAAPLTDGNWHNVIATWDGKNFRVYVDGVGGTAVPDPYGLTLGSGAIMFGRNGTVKQTVYTYYAGLMDEIEFFNSGISADDAASIAAGNF